MVLSWPQALKEGLGCGVAASRGSETKEGWLEETKKSKGKYTIRKICQSIYDNKPIESREEKEPVTVANEMN